MATSVISNTILDPDGVAVSGVVVEVRLMPTAGFRIDTFTEVARLTRTTTNASGFWSLALERNSNISPTDTWYAVTEYIPTVYGGKRVWTIQVGAINATLYASLIDPLTIPPSGPLGGPLNYLTQSTADARYQGLGSFGGVPLTTSLDGSATGSAGVATSASRSDHDHVVQNDSWTAYTPTFTNLTVGSGTLAAAWTRVGKTIQFRIKFVFGSGSAVGTSPTYSLPTAAAAAYSNSLLDFNFPVMILDSGTANFGGISLWVSSTTASLSSWGSAGATVNAVGITSTSPMTWTTNDGFFVSGSYEAAT